MWDLSGRFDLPVNAVRTIDAGFRCKPDFEKLNTAAITCKDDHHIVEICQQCHLDRTADFVPDYT